MSNEPSLASRLSSLGAGAGLDLSPRQIDQLQLYLQVLARWNQTINLTALPLADFPDETLARLVWEPFVCTALLRNNIPATWFDLGSGGGSPAIPMKIALPAAGLSMVESRSRKVAFLREAVRQVGLECTDVVDGRIEELEATVRKGSVDLITVRAVKIDDGLAAVISTLCSADARVAIFGQIDWTPLAGDFSPSVSEAGILILQRRLFHVEQSAS